jgi:hypothetical protein
MAVTPAGDVCILYEAERKNPEGSFVPATLTFTKFSVDSLLASPAAEK